MSAWSLAIGNLAAQPAPAQPRPAVPVRRKPIRTVTPRPICPHCHQAMKLPDGPKPFSTDEDATLMEMLEAGKSRREIAGALKRQPSSIGSRIATLGLSEPTRNRRSS
jgi:transposase-like protein